MALGLVDRATQALAVASAQLDEHARAASTSGRRRARRPRAASAARRAWARHPSPSTTSGGRAPPRERRSRVGFGGELERDRVHAVPVAGGRADAVREDVAEVRAARRRTAPRCAASRARCPRSARRPQGARTRRSSAIRSASRTSCRSGTAPRRRRRTCRGPRGSHREARRSTGARSRPRAAPGTGRGPSSARHSSSLLSNAVGHGSPPSARVHSSPTGRRAGLPVACGFTARIGRWMPPPPSPRPLRTVRARRGARAGRTSTPSGPRESRPIPRCRRSSARIPATHRQPPLVFAVTRMLGAPEGPYREWAEWVAAARRCRRRGMLATQPADERAAAVRGAAARAERHRRVRSPCSRSARAPVCASTPTATRIGTAADPTSTRPRASRRSSCESHGHRRSAAADAGGRVACGHRPRSARCRRCRRTGASC